MTRAERAARRAQRRPTSTCPTCKSTVRVQDNGHRVRHTTTGELIAKGRTHPDACPGWTCIAWDCIARYKSGAVARRS